MSTLTPSPVRADAGAGIDRHAQRPPDVLGEMARGLRGDKARTWLRRKAVAAWMNILIAAVAAVTVVTAGFVAGQHWPDPRTWGAGAVKLFALWCLSFLPGWLYVRFLGLRAKALWNEYVLNLHRLAWDTPGNLPRPPLNSDFYPQWAQQTARQDARRRSADNIYQQKFEAYYGRQIPSAAMREHPAAPGERGRAQSENYVVSSESLFPVFLATAVLAVGWAAVLWDTRFITAPAGAWDVLKYAFLGSYAFVTSMLIRRFFQSDLRPSAYASAVLRIMLVLLIVAVLHQVFGIAAPVTGHAELATAFVVGFFPLVGLQALQRVTSKALRQFVPPITSDYPLDQLDGFNLWYEARLIEEGVEDMQNLTTMNLVDVILHTRVPVGRLVDWTDQAFLLIHLEQTDRSELSKLRQKERCALGVNVAAGAPATGAESRLRLRRVGIRTATDLLKVFSAEVHPPGSDLPGGELPGGELPGGEPPGREPRRAELPGGEPRQRHFAVPDDVTCLPLPEDQLRLLFAVLAAEPGLTPVWNWQRNGVPDCRG